MTKQTKILTGLLAGAALGTAIALVLATNKNDDLKDKVSDWLCDLFSGTKDKLVEASNLLKDNLSKVKA